MGIPFTRTIHDPIGAIAPPNIVRYRFISRLVGIACIAASPFWLAALFFTSPSEYSYTSSLICVPLMAIVAAALITHATQNNAYFRQLMMVGLLAHMAASSLFLWVGMVVYGGVADTFHYWTVGLEIARQFRLIGWSAFQPPYWSTNLIFSICGVAALLIGDALPTLFIAFSLLSLAGGYLFYRTFTLAFPNGDRWLFGLLVLLSPSILFWSSFVGKDALIQFSIGLTCLGFAELTHRTRSRGLLFCVLGLLGALLIRAHVAAMLGLAMTFAYIAGGSKAQSASKLIRLALIPILIGGSIFLVRQAGDLLDITNNNSTTVIQEANTLTKTSQTGGSAFNEGVSLKVRIAESPFLLFRPFPWEVNSAMSLAAAMESLVLLILSWKRRREIWKTLRSWRDPMTGFLLMYFAIFVIAFGGSISNLGTLLRQRIMMTPPALMLICANRKQQRYFPGTVRAGLGADAMRIAHFARAHADRSLDARG